MSAPRSGPSPARPPRGSRKLGAARRFLVKRAGRYALQASATLLVAALALVAMLWFALRPAPGEWRYTLRLGPWQTELGAFATWRVVTHPLALRLLEGRALPTPLGRVQLQAGAAAGEWVAVCAPCTLPIAALGEAPVRIARAELGFHRRGQGEMRGTFALGEPARAVRGRFTLRMAAASAALRFQDIDTPMADAYALFDRVIPELRYARIDGRLQLDGALSLPAGEWTLAPVIEGFRVAGLGTELLLDAEPACGRRMAGTGFGRWLPKAVIAAEDQRFYEHTGFDLAEITAAWSRQRPGGGSTLSQQLAKLLFTGDAPGHVRKLRELLYAVELDRTLGKARVLHLYLSMAPWGQGQCGAHAAALHYLRKPARRLTATEAAWLASLLRNPDRSIMRMTRQQRIDVERVGWVIDHLRPMRASRREALRESLATWDAPLGFD